MDVYRKGHVVPVDSHEVRTRRIVVAMTAGLSATADTAGIAVEYAIRAERHAAILSAALVGRPDGESRRLGENQMLFQRERAAAYLDAAVILESL